MTDRATSSSSDNRLGGFTLIELLVVISIIALLIGILLPALSKARMTAKAATCAARMSQISVGWGIYADENKGTMVPGQPGRFGDESKNVYWVGNGYQYRPRWYVQMGASAGFYAFAPPNPNRDGEHSTQIAHDVFLCPTVPMWTSTRNNAFGYNYQFLGNSRFRGDDEGRGMIHHPVKIERVLAYAGTVMFADSLGTAAGKPESRRVPNLQSGDREPEGLARGGHGYALDPPRLTGSSDYADTRLSSPDHRSGPDMRHVGGANVAFCDGHVTRMTAAEMGYLVNRDGSIAFSGGESTNRLFSGTARDEDPPSVN
ncbi:MAG: prepilin-type N-terminal cleavage/methylation domain-containing protein [Planctomycetes bacterium]|nr:prepilin-type N-terminal cleavage/methylation domain-containing protein [Planctomycetota bacterium]